ncbi:MAG: hypothetical protein KAI29_18195, partial [Cyclobacteriaceae bacterium]|nr:hypothetical protein [Cyclobacteriaceae bacterium]
EIEEQDGGLHDLPLKLAFFLLKDREGVIDLKVPVRGDLKDPEIKLGTILWDTFKDIIVKTVAAPYDLLAGLLSVDPKEITAIEFAYADTTLTESRKKQLDLLLTLEEKKEGLGIELVYFNDIEKEKEQMGVAEANKEIVDSLATIFKQKRLSLVNDYLSFNNDSTLIFTSFSNPEAPGNMASIPRFEVKYSMKEDSEIEK